MAFSNPPQRCQRIFCCLRASARHIFSVASINTMVWMSMFFGHEMSQLLQKLLLSLLLSLLLAVILILLNLFQVATKGLLNRGGRRLIMCKELF